MTMDIDRLFTYRSPNDSERRQIFAFRRSVKALAHMINDTINDGAEKTLAIRKAHDLSIAIVTAIMNNGLKSKTGSTMIAIETESSPGDETQGELFTDSDQIKIEMTTALEKNGLSVGSPAVHSEKDDDLAHLSNFVIDRYKIKLNRCDEWIPSKHVEFYFTRLGDLKSAVDSFADCQNVDYTIRYDERSTYFHAKVDKRGVFDLGFEVIEVIKGRGVDEDPPTMSLETRVFSSCLRSACDPIAIGTEFVLERDHNGHWFAFQLPVSVA